MPIVPGGREYMTKYGALSEELEVAIALLKEGLGHVQSASGRRRVFLVHMLLLSAGLERLLKVVLIYRVTHAEDRFPGPAEIERTHDVKALLEDVLGRIPSDEFASPAHQDDLRFLREDPLLRQLLDVLSAFGRSVVRYWNLEVVEGREPEPMSPHEAWASLGRDISEEELGKMGDDTSVDWLRVLRDRTNRRFVATMERAIRAICRLFRQGGPLGPEAAAKTEVIGEFLFLKDEELGNRRYADMSLDVSR